MSFTQRYMRTKKDRSDREYTEFNPAALIRDLAILLVSIIFISVIWPFYSVPTGSRGVVTRFGKIISIEQEGLVTLWPWYKITLFSIRAEMSGANNAGGGTKDQQEVLTSLTVRYSILPDKVAFVFEHYSHDGDLSHYVFTATAEVFKAVTAKFTAPELLSRRADVSQAVYDGLTAKLDKYGAQVINVDMTDFKWADPEYAKSISAKVTQDQLLQVAEKKALTTQADQQSNVYIAEAGAAAVKAKADGDAYATIKNAEASSEAIKLQNAALAQSGQVLELRRIEVQMAYARQWKGEVPATMYGSAPIPFVQGK